MCIRDSAYKQERPADGTLVTCLLRTPTHHRVLHLPCAARAWPTSSSVQAANSRNRCHRHHWSHRHARACLHKWHRLGVLGAGSNRAHDVPPRPSSRVRAHAHMPHVSMPTCPGPGR
eukprot:360897-Chlamydomonas_euryale.AAC.4